MPSQRSLFACNLALAAWFSVSAAPAAEIAAAASDQGPLVIQDPFLVTQGLLTLGLEGSEVLPAGRLALELQHTFSNTFVKSGFEEFLDNRPPRAPLGLEQLREVAATTEQAAIYLVDGELSRFDLSLRYGVGGRAELYLILPWLEVDGGRSDGVVESFHSALGLAQNQRTALPKDELTIFLRSRGADVERRAPAGYALGDAEVGLKVKLLGNERRGLAVLSALKLPTGRRSALVSSGAADFGFQLLGRIALGAGRIHGHLSAVSLGGWEELDIPARTVLSAGLAYERGVGGHWDLVLQLDAAQSPFDSRWGNALSSPTFLGSIGGRRALSARRSLFFALSENLFNFDNGADFGLHFGLRQRF